MDESKKKQNAPQEQPEYEAAAKTDELERKTPERVMRTYQQDLARVTGKMQGGQDKTPEQTSPEKPQPEIAKREAEDVSADTSGEKEDQTREYTKEEVVRDNRPEKEASAPHADLGAARAPTDEEIRSYAEELKTAHSEPKVRTFDADLESVQPGVGGSRIESGVDQAVNDAVITEEASAPKKGIIAAIANFFGFHGGGSPEKEPAALPSEEKIQRETEPSQENLQPQGVEKFEKKPEEPEKPPEKPSIAPQKPQQKTEPAPVQAPRFIPEEKEPQPEERARARRRPEVPKQKPGTERPPLQPLQQKRPEDIPDAEAIQTFTSDAQARLKNKDTSSLTLLAEEQDAGRGGASASKDNALTIISISLVLIVLAIALLVGAYFFVSSSQETSQEPSSPRVVAPVFADSRIRVESSTTPTLQSLDQLSDQVNTPGGRQLTHVTFAQGASGVSELVSINEIFAASDMVPPALARTIGQQSMFGYYGSEREPVFILVVSSFSQTFQQMLAWEEDMPQALEGLYGPAPRQTQLSTTTSTSTPSVLRQPAFADREVGVYDTRALIDAEGEVHFLYGFVQERLLIIAQSEDVFRAIEDRLDR